MKKSLQLAVILLILGGLFFYYFSTNNFSGSFIKEGDLVPDFTLKTKDGRKVSLSQYRGKVVILNFWATWCSPCVTEIPSLNQLGASLKDENLEIIAVSLDTSWSDVDELFTQLGVPKFTVVLDEEGQVTSKFGTQLVPESFIIDQNGVVIKKIIGAIDWNSNDTRHMIKLLLNG
ncbi:MAG TPA: redoxin domain-containing protein [Bdellovibrionota bacterium]|nr:redoxin domain-containing protein [Bdellovibrionota bacterium]